MCAAHKARLGSSYRSDEVAEQNKTKKTNPDKQSASADAALFISLIYLVGIYLFLPTAVFFFFLFYSAASDT